MKRDNLIQRLVKHRLKTNSGDKGHRCGGMARGLCFAGKQRTVPANPKN